MRHLLYASLILGSAIGNAQYAGPESVEYDPVSDRYFVSCKDDNTIKQRAQDGTVTAFVTNTGGSPFGIELKGDTLFANIDGAIRGFRTDDGSEVFELNLGGSFLNGLTTDGHFLYAADFSQKKIYKVDPDAGTFTTLVAATTQTPNGCVYDHILNRLWVVFWGSNARIKSYDPATGAELSTFTTALGNIDGVTLDCENHLLVSSWTPNRITRFENTFTEPAETVIGSGLSSPADIDFDEVHGRVCIPNSGNNTVIVPEVAGCSTAIREEATYQTLNAVPNPTDGLVRIDLEFSGPQPFMVLSEAGLLIASGTLNPHALLDVSDLAAGIYVIDFARLKRYVRLVKR